MKRFLLSLLFLLPAVLWAQDSTLVRIETTMGNLTVKLYDDTPLHRDNFLKLVREGFYDGTLFHRVIPGFMIQAGDPASKTAPSGTLLGEGDLGYTLPAEIRFPKRYHHRGALCAAREGDDVNPQFNSSACQFYLVGGRRFTPFNFPKARQAAEAATGIQYTDSMMKDYLDRGGAPWLDGTYTVFGEVVENVELIDAIENVARDANNRPLTDVRILRAYVLTPSRP